MICFKIQSTQKNFVRIQLKLIQVGLLILLFFVGKTSIVDAQTKGVIVDEKGVMRWEKTREEIKGFGVNYGVPFAHSFRSAKRLGIDIKKAIDQDIYHFKRMGFDLFRVHVWDTEISDTLGNILENEHLEAFDYLVSKLKEKNINMVLTPIAFWGNGWPEPDEDTPGFSHRYGKGNSLSNPLAIQAAQNYLTQFLNRVNPLTNTSYKDEPHLIAIEISNEPHHRGDPEIVTQYVRGMVDAVKATQIEKPIFYNISHAVQFAEAYFKGGIDGGTFQWYPTGLTFQKELQGNLLPNVNQYDIPFDSTIQSFGGAKLVYEFDAADVAKSYIYPVMARSFREAGIQIATQFAYDPTYLAPFNTDYNTHYFNLSYTPSKSIALMISKEVFHNIPMYSDFGEYPKNLNFGDFQVDYKNDLALFNSSEKLYYSNSHQIPPKSPEKLKAIAGFGNSPIVKYEGRGAYFLDQLDDGLWRLEIMPDAIAVDNPFGRNSPKKIVTELNWKTNQMSIHLASLGDDFFIQPINSGNSFNPIVKDGSFQIYPGTYLVNKREGDLSKMAPTTFNSHNINAFFSPQKPIQKNWFLHQPPTYWSESKSLHLSAQFLGPETPISLTLMRQGFGNKAWPMKKNGYTYQVEIPENELREGAFSYFIAAEFENGKTLTYPSGNEGLPNQWDFFDLSTYQVEILNSKQPIILFDPRTDNDKIHVSAWSGRNRTVRSENPLVYEYQLTAESLWNVDNENLNAEPRYDLSMNFPILEKIEGRLTDLNNKNTLVLIARALEESSKVQVALTMDNGSSYGKTIEISSKTQQYEISLQDLELVGTVTLPRPYPSFLPYYFEHSNEDKFDISRIEKIQISIGPGLNLEEQQKSHGVAIQGIYLK